MHFDHLLPETIFKSVTDQGFQPTGVLYPLNSYENRVYEVGIEESSPLIIKYYRPGRWSLEALQEEHAFMSLLKENEIPLVSPLPLQKSLSTCSTLSEEDSIHYTIYPKFRGAQKSELNLEDRQWMGRLLARLHNLGASFKTKHRLTLTPQTYGDESLNWILSQEFLPDDLKKSVEICLKQAIDLTRPYFNHVDNITTHGDCHLGNILWDRNGPNLLDFDDMVVAPAIQDIWLLFHGDADEQREQQKYFFEGYETFRPFNRSTLVMTEPLRTLRMIRHAAWIGQRYSEPAFQKAFPYYEQRRYWEEFLQSIKEQISLLLNVSSE